MKDLIATSVAQNRSMATDRAQGQNLGTRPKLGHYVRLQGGENMVKMEPNRGFDPDLYKYCLLYTSPSPRDKRQSRMPSSA